MVIHNLPFIMLGLFISTLTHNFNPQITFPTKAGMFIEFVANPIGIVIAASTPRYSATSRSRSR